MKQVIGTIAVMLLIGLVAVKFNPTVRPNIDDCVREAAVFDLFGKCR